MEPVDQSPEWQALTKYYNRIKAERVADQFAQDAERFTRFSLQAPNVFLDYSKNLITDEGIRLLLNLAIKMDVVGLRDRMWRGEAINSTEGRPVLHNLLRAFSEGHDERSIAIRETLQRIGTLVEQVRNGVWLGATGERITDVVNIGIGGSDLGPAMVVQALTPYATKLRLHFVSNVDASHLMEVCQGVDPRRTLFVIASKTFTTQETLTNANTARAWLLDRLAHQQTPEAIVRAHFIAVTAKVERAKAFGIPEANLFPFWDWVGGRFSLWSSIGVSIALALGMENFKELLYGAKEMDEHFQSAPLEQNLPVILALLGIWNINFGGATSLAMIPYDQYLGLLPAYLQQLEMESNGKSINRQGEKIAYSTAPIIWGATGTNSQHSFHQLIMQGTARIAVDFILPLTSHHPVGDHHTMLCANCLAQSQAMMQGYESSLDAQTPEEASLARHKQIIGNIPSNTLIVEKLTPRSLGSLLALYEHKVLVQGGIWQINSFDQWGVELGKKLANKLLPLLQHEGDNVDLDLDSSTAGLIALCRRAR